MTARQQQEGSLGGLSKLVLLLNIGAVLGLIIALIAPGISPRHWWVLEFIALSYPLWILANICFIVYWALLRHRLLFFSLSLLLFSVWKAGMPYILIRKEASADTDSGSIKVMTYNVRLFDLYNWTGNVATRAQMMNFIKDESPDIACFQEYYTSESKELPYNNNDTIALLLDNANSHVEYGITLRGTDHWGLATFTKYPIVRRSHLFFHQGSSNFALVTDLIIKKDTVRLYNVHLQSNHFRKTDYEFLEHPDSGSNEQILQGVRGVAQRMKRSCVKRARQVDELARSIEGSPYPVLVCGDFNDPPFSYSYRSVTKILSDAYLEAGSGFGITYFGMVPPLRIDYLLHSNDFTVKNFDVVQTKCSDHYPVIGKVVLKR